jgi:uncharacterized protein YchJ
MLRGLLKESKAPTEKLMRSRYSAYARQESDYLVATTHPYEGNTILKRISWHGHAATIGKSWKF